MVLSVLLICLSKVKKSRTLRENIQPLKETGLELILAPGLCAVMVLLLFVVKLFVEELQLGQGCFSADHGKAALQGSAASALGRAKASEGKAALVTPGCGCSY